MTESATPEELANDLLGEPDLEALEVRLIEEGASPDMHTAAKLARSKRFLTAHEGPAHVSVVFAMYKETRRMLRPDQDPLGEDFIGRKAAQLRWLFDGGDGWDLVMVDDGCPDGSGELAEEIINENGLDGQAQVLFLADAIEDGHPAASGLTSTDDSRKGGSILYGMYEAAHHPHPGHVVIYTDADVSTNLGQSGLLVEAVNGGATCAAGSRREPTSFIVKGGSRNDRGKLFIYLWKQMLPQLRDIIDTQCGFKGFTADAIDRLTTDAIEKQFAFDIELLLRCAIEREDSIAKVAVAWVDSEAASTTADLEPYLDMLQAVARMYRHYSESSQRPEEFASLIESLAQGDWQQLVSDVPGPIVEREPMEYATWSGVDASDLRARI